MTAILSDPLAMWAATGGALAIFCAGMLAGVIIAPRHPERRDPKTGRFTKR